MPELTQRQLKNAAKNKITAANMAAATPAPTTPAATGHMNSPLAGRTDRKAYIAAHGNVTPDTKPAALQTVGGKSFRNWDPDNPKAVAHRTARKAAKALPGYKPAHPNGPLKKIHTARKAAEAAALAAKKAAAAKASSSSSGGGGGSGSSSSSSSKSSGSSSGSGSSSSKTYPSGSKSSGGGMQTQNYVGSGNNTKTSTPTKTYKAPTSSGSVNAAKLSAYYAMLKAKQAGKGK